MQWRSLQLRPHPGEFGFGQANDSAAKLNDGVWSLPDHGSTGGFAVIHGAGTVGALPSPSGAFIAIIRKQAQKGDAKAKSVYVAELWERGAAGPSCSVELGWASIVVESKGTNKNAEAQADTETEAEAPARPTAKRAQLHGLVFCGGGSGGLAWHPDETNPRLVYVAEAVRPLCEQPFVSSSSAVGSGSASGSGSGSVQA